jgi:CARDB
MSKFSILAVFLLSLFATTVSFGDPLSLTPNPIDFGNVDVGATGFRQLHIQTTTNVRIEQFTITLPFSFSSNVPGPISLASGAVLTLGVNVIPTLAGTVNGRITIQMSPPAQPSVAVVNLVVQAIAVNQADLIPRIAQTPTVQRLARTVIQFPLVVHNAGISSQSCEAVVFLDNTAVSTLSIPAISTGSDYHQTVAFVSNLKGSHLLKVVVDTTQVVPEKNEGNNSTTLTINLP